MSEDKRLGSGEFEASAWAREDFSRNYLDRADVYIFERRRMFAMAASFLGHFFGKRKNIRLLELGSGDGALSHELLKANPLISATLVDASGAMLDRARERLRGFEDISYARASFQELISGEQCLDGGYDLAVSSMAIHHLSMEHKAALFSLVHGLLNGGGAFLNIDVVLAPSEGIESWYFARWRGWMEAMQGRLGLEYESPEDIIVRYKSPESMNRPDTLSDQLSALLLAGFVDVDCHFKDGIFAVFGGAKA